ncbi:MAG: aldehyde dehydrogenase family protein, partial [Chloroflexi bacterium]
MPHAIEWSFATPKISAFFPSSSPMPALLPRRPSIAATSARPRDTPGASREPKVCRARLAPTSELRHLRRPSVTTEARPRLKITYATLRNDNEELHAQFDAGVAKVRSMLGQPHQNYVGGAWRDGDGTFEKRTPIDGSVMGTFARGSRKDVQDAIAAARAAFPAWGRRPWRERVALLRRAADIISERQMEFGALLAMEVGKNRLEALGDVEETADLIRWSCDTMERNHGFDDPMGNLGDAAVHTRSVLKPYGVWGVISPFNFPFALSGGPAGGALVAGNAVVYKPSSDAPLSGLLLTQSFV